jgi:bifunctional UDP-N-acetylglucosamine pyrophosphorylase/glucosamine-1-phosphate N-acetyltransferase
VISALDFWRDYQDYLLVINGDSPLVKVQTIKNMQRYMQLVEEYENIKLSALLLSGFFPDPTGYGRVVKDQGGNVIKIVEEKDATIEEKQIREINGGVYFFYCPSSFGCGLFHPAQSKEWRAIPDRSNSLDAQKRLCG